jgi:hypothetical protein
MTAYKLTVLQLREVNSCNVVCHACKTAVSVPLDVITHVPESCPSCHLQYEPELSQTLSHLRQARMAAQQAESTIEFHIKEPASESASAKA